MLLVVESNHKSLETKNKYITSWGCENLWKNLKNFIQYEDTNY